MKSEQGSEATCALPFAEVVLHAAEVREVVAAALSARVLARRVEIAPGSSFLLLEALAGVVVDVTAEVFEELWGELPELELLEEEFA